MKVLFAPDYREGGAYQQLLAGALRGEGVEVDFLTDYRRGLPLARALRGWRGDVLHLHWPEKYFQRRGDRADFFRKVRYPLDLALALRRVRLAVTAHDLRPHNRGGEALLHANFRRTYLRADTVFTHSEAARQMVCETYHIRDGKCCVIPHGDLSSALGPLPERAAARRALGVDPNERICLLFGTVEPYKGIEPAIEWWRDFQPATRLAIVGRPLTDEYATALVQLARHAPRIRFDLAWQSDGGLKNWLAAADCTLFNYRAILTSGAASLARSLGLPILIPDRLRTVDLHEPHSHVIRFSGFEQNFAARLAAALALTPDPQVAQAWREATSWPHLAARTALAYRAAVSRGRT